METIPDIGKDPFQIQVREDGHFATADFTLFPQWYAQGTNYLPFVRKKSIVVNDLYEIIWYNIGMRDFMLEQGSIGEHMGRLTLHLAHSFANLSKELMGKVKALVVSQQCTSGELKNMLFCQHGMQFMSLALLHAPQN